MNADFSKLTPKNRATYFDMAKYLSEKHIRKSDYDRVCEDIFLMISDAQERGESAETLFPNGMQEFCDDVAANCAKEKWYITLLNVLACTFAVLSAITFIEILFIKLWADGGEWVSGVNTRMELSGLLTSVIAAAAGMVVSILSSKFVFKKFIYDKKPGFYFYALLVTAAAIVIALVLNYTVNGVFIQFNWVALAVGALAAAPAAQLVKILLNKFTAKK